MRLATHLLLSFLLPSLPFPSLPFPSFFASSASLAPSASPREHVSCRCFFVRYHLSRLINHYRKFRQKTTSFVRAPDTRLVGTSCHSLTVFSLSLSLSIPLSLSLPLFFQTHNCTIARFREHRERWNDFFCVSSSVFSSFPFLLAMNHKFGGARREARAASCNARKTEPPLCVPFIYPSTITP